MSASKAFPADVKVKVESGSISYRQSKGWRRRVRLVTGGKVERLYRVVVRPAGGDPRVEWRWA